MHFKTHQNNSSMLKRMPLRISISVAKIYVQLLLWLREVVKSFYQSEKLIRGVFRKAPPEKKLPPHQFLKVILPQYGLVKSSSCFLKRIILS